MMMIMWLKQGHKPPMTGNGKFAPTMNMMILGMVCDCFTHISDNNGTVRMIVTSF